MNKINFNRELRAIWRKVRDKHATHPVMAMDIEEFLRQEEWGLALEHILDWAAAEKKLHLIDKKAGDLKQKMESLTAKDADKFNVM